MKKTYSKPQIVFDSFELSQSIAADCEHRSNHAYLSCALEIGGGFGTIFTDAVSACGITAVDGEYDNICYDVPAADNNVFSS